MQPLQPAPGKARVFAMQSSRKSHASAYCAGLFPLPSSCQEPHSVKLCSLVCHAAIKNVLQPSAFAGSQPRGPLYSACSQGGPGGGTCSRSMQRGPVWHDTATPQRAHAAQYMQPRQAMQIRPESRCTGLAEPPYIHHTRRIARAVSGHFKRFSSVSVNRRQCSAMQSRLAARN